MCNLIHEFIKSGNGNGGYGYFAGDKTAVSFSEKISRSQIRKFKRYGVIPANFIRYLENIGAIERKKFVPEKYRTVYWLLDLLWETPNRNKADRSEGECIRVEILKDMAIKLKKAMSKNGKANCLLDQSCMISGVPQ